MRQDKVVGAKYVNLEDLGVYAKVGDILELIHDDGSSMPKFRNLSSGNYLYRNMDCVAMLAGEEETKVVPVPHMFAVGDKVKVVATESAEYFETSCTGEIATVTDLMSTGGTTHFAGDPERTPAYKVLTECGAYQNVTENQMEKVAEHISDEEYASIEIGDTVVIREDLVGGQYYGMNYFNPSMESARGNEFIVRGDIGHAQGILLEGNFWSWTQQMIEKVIPAKKHITAEEFATLEAGDKFVVRNDLEAGDDYGLWVNPLMLKNAGETLTVKAVHFGDRVGTMEDFYYYTADMIAEVIKKPAPQWDNPEVKAGDVIARESIAYPEETVLCRVKRKTGDVFHFFSSLYTDGDILVGGKQSHVEHWRKATPEEVAELEDAEKKHVVKLPLINNKGTVIEAGKYYVGCGNIEKVISVDLEHNRFETERLHVDLDGDVRVSIITDVPMRSIFGESLLPATLEQIALYDTAVAFHKAKEQLSA